MEDISLTEKVALLGREISDERERLSTDRMDISFGELINLYKNGELTIRPEYQRFFRWTAEQKTALIESILLGIPVPPIFVAEDENGVWELVDGLQRVSTFISFFGELSAEILNGPSMPLETEVAEDDEVINIANKWVLDAGSLIKSLEGFDIDSLPTKYKINLKRAVCRVEILRGESNIAMKYELFKRLNSGGSKLTPQEIRNAIYRGINPVLNDLILELNNNPVFQKLTSLSKQKKQELYDQELVLRFLAFFNNVDRVNENMENFLNRFMEESVKTRDFNVDYYRNVFIEVMNLIDHTNDISVFRNANNLFVPAHFEGITIGLAQNLNIYKSDSALLTSKIIELKQDADFKRFSGSASNSKSRIKTRLTRANQIFSV